jgi:hypothetical protein
MSTVIDASEDVTHEGARMQLSVRLVSADYQLLWESSV